MITAFTTGDGTLITGRQSNNNPLKWNTHFTSGETPYTSKTPLDITNNEKNTFLKIFFTYNERSHMAPFYIYSGREKNSNGAFKICSKNPSAQTAHDPVKVSDILDCTSNIQAYFDEPVLIHTLYNIENLGNDIDEWESHTPNEQELKVEIITDMQDGKYTKTPYDYFIPRAEVPKGYYYCTIVHFADGSAKMGQVLYK